MITENSVDGKGWPGEGRCHGDKGNLRAFWWDKMHSDLSVIKSDVDCVGENVLISLVHSIYLVDLATFCSTGVWADVIYK